MIDHPEEIRVHHFSADQKPSMILVNDMASVEGWLEIEDHLRKHAEYMMEMHGHKNKSLHSQPEWKGKIEQFLRGAYLEWFDAWKRTYVNMVNYVLDQAYKKMVCTRRDDGEHVQCPCCEEEWHREDVERNSDIIRDHLLFNCDVLASEIKIPVKHQINLMTFFFVPCGPQVKSKLYYLAEVYKFYVGKNKPSRSIFMAPLPLNPNQQPQILHPLYIRRLLQVLARSWIRRGECTSMRRWTQEVI